MGHAQQTVQSYFAALPQQMHFALEPQLSDESLRHYRMLAEYGQGTFRLIDFNHLFLIAVADFTPSQFFEKVTEVSQPYMEISQFETSSSSWRVGKQRPRPVGHGLCSYVNTSRTAYSYCEAGKPVRFTKILITQEYYEQVVQQRYGDDYRKSLSAMQYLTQNTNSPQLNFIFQQIRDCNAAGTARKIYLESKVMEVLALLSQHYSKGHPQGSPAVKLGQKDRRALSKTITLMKKDLAAYPSVRELAQVAGMSDSRYQLAFKQVYGTTVYEYLKALRMNRALLMLNNSDLSISAVAEAVGYTNAGHFAGLFKKLYGLTPKAYRMMQGH